MVCSTEPYMSHEKFQTAEWREEEITWNFQVEMDIKRVEGEN